MKYLNNLWLTLLIAGIAVLFFAIGIQVFEGLTGINSTDFSSRITEIPATPLIPDDLESHLVSSGEL